MKPKAADSDLGVDGPGLVPTEGQVGTTIPTGRRRRNKTTIAAGFRARGPKPCNFPRGVIQEMSRLRSRTENLERENFIFKTSEDPKTLKNVKPPRASRPSKHLGAPGGICQRPRGNRRP